MRKPALITSPFPDPAQTARTLGIPAARRRRLEQMLADLWASESDSETRGTPPGARVAAKRGALPRRRPNKTR